MGAASLVEAQRLAGVTSTIVEELRGAHLQSQKHYPYGLVVIGNSVNSIVLPSVPMAEDDGRREPLSWRKSSVLPLSEADRPS